MVTIQVLWQGGSTLSTLDNLYYLKLIQRDLQYERVADKVLFLAHKIKADIFHNSGICIILLYNVTYGPWQALCMSILYKLFAILWRRKTFSVSSYLIKHEKTQVWQNNLLRNQRPVKCEYNEHKFLQIQLCLYTGDPYIIFILLN